MTYVGQKPANKPVNQTDIEDDAISLAKLAGGTDGNIISYDASGNPVAIATGNDGQVLTSTGAGSPPAFEAAPSSTADGFFASSGLSAKDLGVGLHIKTGDSGGSADAYANELVIEDNDHAGIQLLSGTTGSGNIDFGDSGSTVSGQIYYDHNANTMFFKTNGNHALKIDSAGIITKPLQPAFIVKPTSDSSSHTLVDMATGTHTMKFGTEILDANADFASNTFTAPVDGAYQMNVNVGIGGLDTATTLLETRVHTSNVMYRTIQNNLGNDFNADTNETQTFCGSVMVYMDANDTCTVTISLTGGGGQMDVLTGSTTQPQTCWSGFLVA